MQNSSAGISSIRVVLIDGAILTLTFLLNCIDFVLVQAQKIYVAARPPAAAATSSSKPKVVIVGASFGGLAVEHALSKYSASEVQVTVIDYKEYFEYVPGALRCFIEPDYFLKGLSCPLSVLQEVNGTRVVSGEVVGVQTTAANSDSCVALKDGRTVPFDYLVLAVGSTYPSPIKATPAQPTITQRQAQWHASAHELKEAKTVLILGAGAVGVELAAEILTKYPSTSPTLRKRVLIIDTASQILPGFHPSSVKYCTEWLLRHGAELKLGAPLQRLDDGSAVRVDGATVNVDLFYKCVGVAPATSFLQTSPLGSALKGPRGSIVVNDHLQVEGLEHIFCIGDMCHHAPSSELKLGHTAEVNGHLAAANVLRMIRNTKLQTASSKQPLLSYPMGVVGNTVTPKIYDLSLGKYDATLGMNSLVIHGGLAAVVKWLLEWTKVAAAQQRPIGILFWIIADFVSNLLGRTILPTATPAATSVAAAARDKRI
jgi:NADH dehydrogenase FAD-containing subunit